MKFFEDEEDISAITYTRCFAFLAYLKKFRYSYASVILSIFGQMFHFAEIYLNIVNNNPRKLPPLINHDEINYRYYEFADYLKFRSFSGEYQTLFDCLFFLGLRISELRGLKLEDIKGDTLYLTHQRIHDRYTDLKSRTSKRTFIIPDFISFPPIQSEFIFPQGQTTIRRANIRIAGKAGLPFINLHGFRHSCASYLINTLHRDIFEVSKYLGHSSVEITSAVYGHMFTSVKRDIATAIDKSFESQTIK